jgi:hypothetical protein
VVADVTNRPEHVYTETDTPASGAPVRTSVTVPVRDPVPELQLPGALASASAAIITIRRHRPMPASRSRRAERAAAPGQAPDAGGPLHGQVRAATDSGTSRLKCRAASSRAETSSQSKTLQIAWMNLALSALYWR